MNELTRLKIGYLCDISPLDRNLYSGGNARIHDALQRHVGDVTILSNSWHAAEPVRRLVHAMPEAINLRARWRLHLMLSRIIARGVQRELAQGQYNVLFGAYSFQSMRHIRPPCRMVKVFTADATPTTYKRSVVGQSYGSMLSLSRYLDPLVLRAERQIFSGLDLMLWPTEWLKSGADALYDLNEAQSLVVPWGANIDAPEAETTPLPLVRGAPVRLLFIGRDWEAKGGPLVRQVVERLRNQGVDARLSVIGATPPDTDTRDHIETLGELNKSDPAQMARFETAMRSAHFLVMPSFESFGFAFCEASAYSLPALCLRVGGVPVTDEINGHALPLGAEPADFAEIIMRYLNDPDDYAALRRSARIEYETRLNWDSWGQRVAEILSARVSDPG